ncbi:unnamed protein product, partial [marine sediment metagenome]
MNRSHLSLKCSIHATSGTGGRMDRIIKPVKVVKRGRYYQLYYYSPDGRRRRLSVGSDYRQAQRMTVKFADWLLEGKDPEHEMERAKQAEQAKVITVRDFYHIFLSKHGSKQSESMQKLYHYNFKNICRCPQLANKLIGDITESDVLDYMDLRMEQDGVRPATVNRES